MKILILSPSNSVHTQKWAKGLAKNGLQILIYSLFETPTDTYEQYENIQIVEAVSSKKVTLSKKSGLNKLRYLKTIKHLRAVIKDFKPDIVHAHYASSNGLLGALSKFHPFVISVWGTDVYDFPYKSILHKLVLKFNLRKTDKILSTSYAMAKQTRKFTQKEIEVTPFGIDLNKFKHLETKNLFNENDIVIGTVKTLDVKYGIKYLIEAFKIVKDKYPELPLKLLIVGGGSEKDAKNLKDLAGKLKISNNTIFTGNIPFEEVPKYHNMLTVSVSVSLQESFGVAIIEASACEKAVVVSNVGGLPEVVEDGVTGIVVPPKNAKRTADAIEKLIFDDKLRVKMGKAGRERVNKLYNWNDNVLQMIDIYKDILTLKK